MRFIVTIGTLVLAAAWLVGRRQLQSERDYAKKRPPNGPLSGKRVAILATDGFEQVELTTPREALERAGAKTVVVSPKSGAIQGFHHHDKADKVPVDMALADAEVEAFDALLLPGGALNPDALRADARAVAFVKAMSNAGKPIAAICHGPWTLAEADVIQGKKMTSWGSIKSDLRNAGAEWVDEAVVADGNLVTSRSPADLPVFDAKILEVFAQADRRATRPTQSPIVRA